MNDDWGSSWNRHVDVTADENGNITDQFNLPDWFVATYSVIATGPLSGTATTSFTDANVTVSPLRYPAARFQSVTAGSSFDFTATVSRGGPATDPNPIATGFTTTGTTGSPDCGLPGATPNTVAGWVSLPAAPVTISSTTGQSVTFRVTVPSGRQPATITAGSS